MVKPELRKIMTSTEGHILKLYDRDMFADVRVKQHNGRGQMTLVKVPIQMGSGGFSQSGPFQGDKVIVTFKNNNPNNPIVTSIVESNFQTNWEQTRFKHSRKGALCPDGICDRIDWNFSSSLYK